MIFFETRLLAGLGELLPGKIYLAAVSGGADSTAMLAGLAELRSRQRRQNEAGFVLRCIHVEHGIRPAAESRGDAAAVEALCEKLGVPCRVISIPPGRIAAYAGSGGPGIEGAARFFRMRALRAEARRVGAARILIAHTRDDLLETLLMRVLRGSGPAGLAAMPRSRGRILRPLLDLGRQDVLNYLKERGLSYRTDSTNADIQYLRNRVRLKLVPLLDEFFPAWRSSLPALAETQSLAAAFLASETRLRLPWERMPRHGESGGRQGNDFSLRLPEADFFGAPPILREEALFAGVDMLAEKAGANAAAPRGAAVRRTAVRRAAGQEAASARDLGPVRFCRKNGFVEMTKVPGRGRGRYAAERGFSLLIKEAGFYTLKGEVPGAPKGSVLRIEAGFHGAEESTPGGAAGSAVFSAGLPLVLRNHAGSDRLFLAGHGRRFSDILDRKAGTGGEPGIVDATSLTSAAGSGYTGIVTAEDAEGNAAFICLGGDLRVISRETPQAGSLGAAGHSFFRIFLDTGGIDV